MQGNQEPWIGQGKRRLADPSWGPSHLDADKADPSLAWPKGVAWRTCRKQAAQPIRLGRGREQSPQGAGVGAGGIILELRAAIT